MAITLEIHSPQGRRSTVELDGRPAIIGRPTPGHEPDVPLDDPRRWVSRQHCLLEAEGGTWFLTDQGTDNGTFVRRGGTIEQAVGRVQLREGDLVCLLGDRTDDGRPLYWQLGLLSQGGREVSYATEPAAVQPSGSYVEYDLVQARLFHYLDGREAEVDLTGNEHKLISHMASRNQQAGGVAVACRKEELLSAVWGDSDGAIPFGIDDQNLRDLVGGLRKKLEPHPMQILQTVPDLGYRLWTSGQGTPGSG